MQYTTLVPPQVAPGTVMTCSRCSHKWAIRKRGDIPKNCPKCRSTLWMKNYHVYTCMKCQHEWGTANEHPQRCPKCHTSKWNSPVSVPKVKSETVHSRLSPEAKSEVFALYSEGKSSMTISIEMKISYSEVMDTLLEKYAPGSVRV